MVREGHWQDAEGTLKVMSMTEAQDQLQPLKLAIDTLCFDPVFGLDGIKSKKVLVIVPVKDLSDKRLDRASDVVFEGESAKISIN